MHAADVVASLPKARLSDPVLSAARMAAEQGVAGLVVADGQDRVVACLSTVDLLWLALPPYLRNEPHLARLFGESHADRIAEVLAERTVGDIVDELAGRNPAIHADATIVELVETMIRRSTALIPVKDDSNTMLGAATANQALSALVSVVDGTRR